MATIDQLIEQNAIQASTDFQWATQVPLDFTEASLQGVEEVLDAAHKGRVNEATRNSMINLLGSYVLHTAKTLNGGAYQMFEERPQPLLVCGLPNYSVGFLAMEKVAGRINGDEGDNIPFFYGGLVRAIERATPGSHALIV